MVRLKSFCQNASRQALVTRLPSSLGPKSTRRTELLSRLSHSRSSSLITRLPQGQYRSVNRTRFFRKFQRTFATGDIPSNPNSAVDVNDDDKSVNSTRSSKSAASDSAVDRRVYPIAVSSLLMGSTIGIVIPLMPQFTMELGMNTLQYGLVISMMGWSRLIFNLPAAMAADRYGRRPLLIGGPLMSAIGMAMTGTLVTSLNALLFSRLITGIGGCIQMAGAQTYISDISKPVNRAQSMAPMQMGFSVGMSLGPVFGGFFAASLGIRNTFTLASLCLAAISVNHYLMCPETLVKKEPEPGTPQVSVLSHMKNTLMNEWIPLMKNDRNTQSVVLSHTTLWFANGGLMMTLVPLFCNNELGLSITTLGYLFAIMAVSNGVLAQPLAYISDVYIGFDSRLKRMAIPGFCILAADALFLPFVNNLTQISIYTLVWSLGLSCIGSNMNSYASDIHVSSNSKRTQSLALMRSGGDLGIMCGSGALSLIAHGYGMSAACAAASVSLLSAAAQIHWRTQKPSAVLDPVTLKQNLDLYSRMRMNKLQKSKQRKQRIREWFGRGTPKKGGTQ